MADAPKLPNAMIPPPAKVEKTLSQAEMDSSLDLSIQERPLDENNAPSPLLGQLGMFYSLSKVLPPYWSPARDAALEKFWRQINILSGAVYALIAKLTTIPFHFEARDITIKSHVDLAARLTIRYQDSADFGGGWITFFSRQIEALLTQDNGRFMELIGEGPKNGPIRGPILSVAHLDSSRCVRTSNPEWPVVYQDISGKRHRLHWSRVAYDSQMPNSRASMNGVGLCAVSRATSYAQHMLDINVYKEEKLGSRPSRAIVLVKGGLSPARLGESLELIRQVQSGQGYQRYSPMAIVGDESLTEPAIEVVDLAKLPDGYDEKESTTIAVAAIALAFGIDMRELWPASEVGSTRADALLSHIKSQGKGPGHILAATQHLFESRVLPPTIKMVFDFQDDTQDKQQADIRDVRALSNERLTRAGVSTIRAQRQNMLRDGDITDAQFAEMELGDGRLPSGEDVTMLFFSPVPEVKSLLTIPGVTNPLDTYGNDPMAMVKKLSLKRIDILKVLARETRTTNQMMVKECLAAIEALIKLYAPPLADPNAPPQPGERGGGPSIPAEERDTEENRPSEASPARPNRDLSNAKPSTDPNAKT